MEALRIRRRYDHRFLDVVRETGNIDLAVKNGVPRSTARDWSRLAAPKIITLDVVSMSEPELREALIELRKRHATLLAILRLVVMLVKVCDVSLRHRRVPDGEKKRLLLRAVDRSKEVLPLRAALLVMGLTKSRYYDWKRDDECELDGVPSCPQSHPRQLTAEEREVVKDMATSDDYRHVPTGSLAVLAQPSVPMIDNFSRRVLDWRASDRFDPGNTLAVLPEAGSSIEPTKTPPTLLADSGVENRTNAIDELVDSGALRRVLAQIEITCSSSMIESWWRSPKHQCRARWSSSRSLENHSPRTFHGQAPNL